MSAARKLRLVPEPADILRDEIADICKQIDHRLDNKPGTAERGIYFWLWPPTDPHDLDVLTHLHADAVQSLLDLINSPEGELPA